MLLSKISNGTGISENEIQKISNQIKKNYSVFKIKKKRKNSGERTITKPSLKLSKIQKWIKENIFEKYDVSEYAYAYVKGRSIKQNAEIHRYGRHILRVDIENFFYNITKNHLEKAIMRNSSNYSLSTEDVELICKLCLINDRVSIGAVTSPIISNIIMYDFDHELSDLMRREGLTYTRYADDLVFSTNVHIEESIVDKIRRTLRDYGFKLNERKTRFMKAESRKKVTGLNITDSKVTVGLKKKKEIKKQLYRFMKFRKGNSYKLSGNLAYIKHIEPNYYDYLINKYSRYGNINDILNIKNKFRSSARKKSGSAFIYIFYILIILGIIIYFLN